MSAPLSGPRLVAAVISQAERLVSYGTQYLTAQQIRMVAAQLRLTAAQLDEVALQRELDAGGDAA